MQLSFKIEAEVSTVVAGILGTNGGVVNEIESTKALNIKFNDLEWEVHSSALVKLLRQCRSYSEVEVNMNIVFNSMGYLY
jgi:hypothetical protein